MNCLLIQNCVRQTIKGQYVVSQSVSNSEENELFGMCRKLQPIDLSTFDDDYVDSVFDHVDTIYIISTN